MRGGLGVSQARLSLLVLTLRARPKVEGTGGDWLGSGGRCESALPSRENRTPKSAVHGSKMLSPTVCNSCLEDEAAGLMLIWERSLI